MDYSGIDPNDQLAQFFKLHNIFGAGTLDPNQSNQPNAVPNNDPSQSQPDLMSAIQGMLNPKDEQFQNYAQMIQAMPKRADYPEPGIWTKIRAHIAALGAGNSTNALGVTDQIEHDKYYKALQDWQTQLDPTGKIAQMEATRNTNLRQIGLGTLQKQQNQEKIDETERENKARDTDRSIRANAYAQAKLWAEQHPNYEGRTDKNGNLYYVNKTDPTDIKETGIDTGKLGDLEKSNLNIKGKLEEIAAQGSQTRQTQSVRQSQGLANAKELEGIRQINRLGLKTTPSGNASINKPLSPAATATDKINKAIEIINARPELAQYFVIGNNKKPTGQLQIPKNADPQDAAFINAQMGASDIKLPSSSNATIPNDVNPKLNTQPQSSRELIRPTTEDPKIKAAKAKVEAGYVLITDGKSFGQVKPEDTSKLPKGWMVVK